MSLSNSTFIQFDPVIKDKVWGGSKLRDVLGKDASSEAGESWEISGVPGSVSLISEGPLKGRSLQELLEAHGPKLVGAHVFEQYGNEFPLLFKFIDAADDLSVQLHPNDALARERHNSFGKTEMWYIVDSDPDSRLILGFNQPMTADKYQEIMSSGQITNVLHEEAVEAGDSYFIATGTVHAIGAGILLAEIQQTSDITYRIYDWDRPDKHGNYRDLHTEEALDAIDYNAPGAKLEFGADVNEVINVCTSNYFVTNRIILSGDMQRSLGGLDSFKVYMCVSGTAKFEHNDSSCSLRKGQTVLVPATVEHLNISADDAILLEVYIP